MQPRLLNRAALPYLPPALHAPAFDPVCLTPGIVHLGLGGFHRAHMARYTHTLMEQDPAAREWGIVGAGLLPQDRAMRDRLAPQDNLYTLLERDGTTETATVIGSLAGVLFAGDDSAGLLDVIDRPAIRIVSLTVTENGYCLNRATKQLDAAHPLIQADLARPARPRSAIGIVTEALRRRRDTGTPPFTVTSYDNIQHNGQVLRAAVLALATLRDPALAAWIGAHVRFPSSMVDRITPVTTDADRAWIAETYGIADQWPVVCEAFTQWVLEDDFPTGRPAWERVGCQFVADVAPYEMMKLRLLNASHLAVAGLGRLMGYAYIHETMADPVLRRYMAALMDRETGPTLPDIPGIDLADHKRTLIARFANLAIKDTTERVNTGTPINILVDPIRARLQSGGGIDLLALALAAWLRRVRGVDEQGAPIDVRHPLAAELREKAEQGGPDPRPLLGITALFGDFAQNPALTGPVGHWLARLYRDGSRATLTEAAQALAF